MDEKIKSDTQKKSQPQPLTKRVTILTTIAILLGNVTFGCVLSCLPPVLDNMRSKYQTTVESIALVFSISTISYCMGALACGFVSKCVNRQLVVILTLVGLATSTYMIPYCPTITLFFVFGGLLGFCSGAYDSSQMVWVIEIWQHKAGPFIQAQHFCFAIGTIFPSVIMPPYLDKYEQTRGNGTETFLVEPSTIHIPFIFMGIAVSLALAFQLFLFTFYRYHTPPMYANENFELIADAKNIPSPIDTDLSGNVSINQAENENVMGISSRKLQLIIFSMLFLGAYQAMEISTMQFLPIFGQYSNLKMTESDSAHVLTGLLLMYAIGRGVGVLIIFKVRPEFILVINFVLVIAGNLVLLIWATESLTMFWIGSILLGTGYSTMYPSFCAFIEKYLVFTSFVASCIVVFGATSSAIYPIIVGKIIEHRAVVLTYTNFGSTSICIAALLWGYNLTRGSVNRER